MGSGGGKTGDIEQRATTDGDEIRVPVHVMAVELGIDFADERVGILGAFAAASEHRWTNEADLMRVGGKILFNLRFQFRHGLGE